MRMAYVGASVAVVALLAWQGSIALLGPRVQTVEVQPRDLVRAVEEGIADTLIDAKQQGHNRVMLMMHDGVVVAKPLRSAA